MMQNKHCATWTGWTLGMLLLGLCQACSQLELDTADNGGQNDEGKCQVRVMARGADSQTDLYPLLVYAFSPSGKLIAQQQMTGEGQNINLQLPKATESTLVVVSADTDIYNLPAAPTLQSAITLKAPSLPADATDKARQSAKGYAASQPLQMGCAVVKPATSQATVSIQLNYKMASANISLAGLPASCTDASVSIASPAQSVDLSGELAGTGTSCIPLHNDNGVWTSGEVYLFPTQGEQTTFTIAINNAGSESFSAVNYMAPLRAGTPYTLNGNYVDDAWSLSGSVTPSEWEDPINLSFDFSPDSSVTLGEDSGSGSDNPSGGDSDDLYEVDYMPVAPCVWNGFLMIDIGTEDGNNTCDALLMSIADFGSVASALHTSRGNEAADIALDYTENGLTGWIIPTKEDALSLRTKYLEYNEDMQSMLTEGQADPLWLTDEKNNNVRYLCEDATKTYSFKDGSSYNGVKDAGATVTTYHLRLVKHIRLHLR